MSKHLFGLIATTYGAAANNRGENDGNITTLQKLLWKNEVRTTVSAEAIRWALRYFWEKKGLEVNRTWDEDVYDHKWRDQSWAPWTSTDEATRSKPTYIDDDALGFMLAEAAKTDGSDGIESLKDEKKRLDAELKAMAKEDKKGDHARLLQQRAAELKGLIDQLSKGKTDKRRGALEVTRAISMSQFVGDITFNSKSGQKSNTSLYGTEVHATRYQYGIALTPESLREPSRTLEVIDAIVGLREVGGNHSRFLFDFSPESVVFRWTDDFAPRILYGFEMDADATVSMPSILAKVASGDIDPSELFIGGDITRKLTEEERSLLAGAQLCAGVKTATQKLAERVAKDLNLALTGV